MQGATRFTHNYQDLALSFQMGTVEKICESLLKSSEERSQHIRGKFEEYSIWLGNEIELMKKLIRKNPRENHALQSKPEVSKLLNST